MELIRRTALAALLIVLLGAVGCARQDAVPISEEENPGVQITAESSTVEGVTEETTAQVQSSAGSPVVTASASAVTSEPAGNASGTPDSGTPGDLAEAQPFVDATRIPVTMSAALPGDASGPQTALSDAELAAQAAGNATYTGQRCRVAVDTHTCDCVQDTITSQFNFPDPNSVTWNLTTSAGSQAYNLIRRGIDTWTATTPAVDDITINVEVLFNPAGYQHVVTVNFPTGDAPTCVMHWTRH